MDLTEQFPQTHTYYPQSIDAPTQATASQTQLAAIGSSRSLDLNLVTQEGDRVSLSLGAQAAVLYASSEMVSVGEDGDYLHRQTELAAGQYRMDFRLSVEGDLNADERREIRKVIKTMNKILNQLASGQRPSDRATANKLSGLDTITSLEAHLAYEQNVVVAQQEQTASVYNYLGELNEIPAGDFKNSASNLGFNLDAIAEEMADMLNRAKAPWADKIQAAERLFEAHRKQAESGSRNQWGPNRVDHVLHRFRSVLAAVHGDMHA